MLCITNVTFDNPSHTKCEPFLKKNHTDGGFN